MPEEDTRTRGYILSYVNPDTDGVCSSVAYSYLKRRISGDDFEPIVSGKVNNETLFVLQHFSFSRPKLFSTIISGRPIVILDTHHKKQLPVNIRYKDVIEIIDHHPAGDVNAFPNAVMQNEPVGAVATLVTERIRNANIQPERRIAGILAAAIISNTLNLNAPSTTDRDGVALEWLVRYVNINQEFIDAMFTARSDISRKSTREILLSDFKEFTVAGLRIGISQLETVGISDFIGRSDLNSCLTDLKTRLKLDHLIFNGVDISRCHSTIVAVEPATQALLEASLEAKFDGSVAIFPRILLRKTDLIPQITAIMGK